MQNSPSKELLGYSYIRFSEMEGKEKHYLYLLDYAAQTPTTSPLPGQKVYLST